MDAGIISVAKSLQELGIIGILGLSNLVWLWIAKSLWAERGQTQRDLNDCLKWKRRNE